MVTDADVRSLLSQGSIELIGQLPGSSNGAHIVAVNGSQTIRAVYKPVALERPLWDFPESSLTEREYATSVVDELLGWDLVPPTVWRTGPIGPGICQLFIEQDDEPDPSNELFALFPGHTVEHGWLPVFTGENPQGEPVTFAHRDRAELRKIAALDVIINNADRKAGHILQSAIGGVGESPRSWSIDHGLTFHLEPKLRTVIWGFGGQPLPTEAVSELAEVVADPRQLRELLGPILSPEELAMLMTRLTSLVEHPVYPAPPNDRNPIPWPLV